MKTTSDLIKINESTYRLRLRRAEQMQDVYFCDPNGNPPSSKEIAFARDQFEYHIDNAEPPKSLEDAARHLSDDIESWLPSPPTRKSAAWLSFTEGSKHHSQMLSRNARAFKSLVGS